MKANELRLGNYIYRNGLMEVRVISKSGVKVYDHVNKMFHPTYFSLDENIQPIQLTEEWLLKFGFIEDSYSYVMGVHQQIFSGLMKFNFNERLNCWEFSIGSYNDLTRIQYVHQLQNLYFALTGEELIIEEL